MSELSIQPLTKFKLVFLGEQAVGKTSLITRFMYDDFNSNYQATIGIDFLSKTMHLEDQTVRLQLWDTAGQERFRSLIPSYVRDSNVALIVYDVTSDKTFKEIDKWITDVKEQRSEEVIIFLIANKTDITEKRLVSMADGEKKAEEHNVSYMETSAKTGYNVKKLFQQVARSLTSIKSIDKNTEEVLLIRQEDQPQNKSSSCSC